MANSPSAFREVSKKRLTDNLAARQLVRVYESVYEHQSVYQLALIPLCLEQIKISTLTVRVNFECLKKTIKIPAS